MIGRDGDGDASRGDFLYTHPMTTRVSKRLFPFNGREISHRASFDTLYYCPKSALASSPHCRYDRRRRCKTSRLTEGLELASSCTKISRTFHYTTLTLRKCRSRTRRCYSIQSKERMYSSSGAACANRSLSSKIYKRFNNRERSKIKSQTNRILRD